jgi:hypothetical protein
MAETEIIFSVRNLSKVVALKPALSATPSSPYADTMDELKLNVREEVQSHFDEAKATFRDPLGVCAPQGPSPRFGERRVYRPRRLLYPKRLRICSGSEVCLRG